VEELCVGVTFLDVGDPRTLILSCSLNDRQTSNSPLEASPKIMFIRGKKTVLLRSVKLKNDKGRCGGSTFVKYLLDLELSSLIAAAQFVKLVLKY
jgi:hypothetical protein